MSVTLETEQHMTIPSFRERLSQIQTMQNPNDQYSALISGDFYRRKPEGLADVYALFDFAANPDSSSSLLVRAQAFEVAYEYIQSGYGDEITLSIDEPEFLVLQEEIHTLLPAKYSRRADLIKNPERELSDSSMSFDPVFNNVAVSGATGEFNPYDYREMIRELAEREDIDQKMLLPEIFDNPDYRYGTDDPIPARALLFLESFAQRIEQYDRGDQPLPNSPIMKLLPLAIDIQKALPEELRLSNIDNPKVDEVARDAAEIGKLFDVLGSLDNRILIERLKEGSRRLPSIFPERYIEGVRKGSQALFVDCVYALNAHFRNGMQTRAEIPLNGNNADPLILELEGDEPIQILRQLTNILEILPIASRYEYISATKVNRTGDFGLYRIWEDRAFDKSRISVYVRPYASTSYDGKLEYGRNGDGVEASISYVIDPSVQSGEVIEVGKHRGSSDDQRVSIRLDREGVNPAERVKMTGERDPMRPDGTLSLDIGSVIGDDNWLSTKIGRLLAWGNLLRAEAMGHNSQLNHSTQYFVDDDGTDSIFAIEAQKLIMRLDSQKINKAEVQRRAAQLATKGFSVKGKTAA